MGLDMYAFRGNLGTLEIQEIAYWRKHNALHSLMEEIFRDMPYEEFMAGQPVWDDPAFEPLTREQYQAMQESDFNLIKLPLNKERLEQIEQRLRGGLQPASGFFFGRTDYDPEEIYGEQDRQFLRDAYAAIEEGDVVLYDSWW